MAMSHGEVEALFDQRVQFWYDTILEQRPKVWEMNDPQVPYSFTAADIVEYTIARFPERLASLPEGDLTEFKRKFYTECEMSKDMRSPFPFTDEQFTQILTEYAVWIDHLFFFGFLTRAGRRDGKLEATDVWVKLRFFCEPFESDNFLGGKFSYTGTVSLNTFEAKLRYLPMSLVCIAHELTHAYLELLTLDNSASRYYRDLNYDDGHGVQFQKLLGFIATQLTMLFPTMPYIEDFAETTLMDMQDAMELPLLSEDVARAKIETHNLPTRACTIANTSGFEQMLERFSQRADFFLQARGNERDRFWEMTEPGTTYDYTINDVARLTQHNCYAAAVEGLELKDDLVEDFKLKWLHDYEWSNTSPFDSVEAKGLLMEYAAWFDRLFFFGTFTRGTNVFDEDSRVQIDFVRGIKLPSGETVNAEYRPPTHEINIDMLQPSGSERYAIEVPIYLLLHEMTHAWFAMLQWEYSAARYLWDLHQDDGHGVSFYSLLLFIYEKLAEWLGPMPRLDQLIIDTREKLNVAFERPFLSDNLARSLIYPGHVPDGRDSPTSLEASYPSGPCFLAHAAW
ncbi:hypothetical protein F4808DRAFT_473524 [Astrocystis sublimbata]|nr:hypothetical protein F4808DRAFT_473524 [Astrocystis sublimbata]